MNHVIRLARFSAALLLLVSPVSWAETTATSESLRILASGSIQDALDAVRENAQTATGLPLAIEYGSSRGNLRGDILAGKDFDVALMLPEVDAELLQQDKILPLRYPIGTVPVAIGVRGDVPTPDVRTAVALKAVLLGARSVTYRAGGTSQATVQKVLGTLGIANSIKDSSRLAKPVELAPGEYEINFFVLSELRQHGDVRNLGPVTSELQVPVVIEAAIAKRSLHAKEAMAFIRFLQGSAMETAMQKIGMSRAAPAPAPVSREGSAR